MKSRLLAIALFLVVLVAPGAAPANGEDSRIVQGNGLYLNGQYEKAAQVYEALIAEGVHNGYLYYNLGNTYIRLKKNGLALLNFIKARLLLPRDEALQANLNYAIGETVDRIPLPDAGGLNAILFWVDDFNREEHLQILVFANFVFWVSLAFWFIFRKDAWDLARKATLALLILALISTAARIHLDSSDIIGVVLAETVDVKSQFGKDNVTLFQLHEGAVVSITGRNGDWLQIELADDKIGWIPQETVGSSATLSHLL